MRLFTAIDIPQPVRERLQTLLHKLRPLAALQWARVDNLHITTKFIGEWPEDRLDEVKRALSAVPKTGMIKVTIRDIGWFPNDRHPRVFWAGVEASPQLPMLAQSTDEAAHSIGVAKEDRPYSPHLTLARIRDRVTLDGLKRALANESADFGSFRAENFYLYLSRAGRYTKLAEFPLT